MAAVRAAGVEVVRLADLVPASKELARNPNQVYTRDAALTLPWLPGLYVRGAMRVPLRRPEAAVLAAALRKLGLREALAPPSGAFLEGGDVIPLALDGRRTLLVGFGPRTARAGLDLLWRELFPSALDALVGVRLAEWRMNLDGALVPVAEDTVVVHPESIEDAFVLDRRGLRPVDVLEHLSGAGMTAIEVTKEEATELQACNVLCLGEGRVVCYDLAPRVLSALRERGLDVRTIPAGELIKGTGGPRCMTRPIYG